MKTCRQMDAIYYGRDVRYLVLFLEYAQAGVIKCASNRNGTVGVVGVTFSDRRSHFQATRRIYTAIRPVYQLPTPPIVIKRTSRAASCPNACYRSRPRLSKLRGDVFRLGDTSAGVVYAESPITTPSLQRVEVRYRREKGMAERTESVGS